MEKKAQPVGFFLIRCLLALRGCQVDSLTWPFPAAGSPLEGSLEEAALPWAAYTGRFVEVFSQTSHTEVTPKKEEEDH